MRLQPHLGVAVAIELSRPATVYGWRWQWVMRVRNLSIKRFRGIKVLDWAFDARFVVLIGAGDSGKSTILDAVALALTPRWNPSLTDADFHGCDPSSGFVIEVTVSDLPDSLIREDRLGHWLRGIAPDGTLNSEPEPADERALTIRLEVDEGLEPRWEVIRETGGPGTTVSAHDRAAVGVFRLGNSATPHLRWSRDSALVHLGDAEDVGPMLVGAHRAARAAVFDTASPGLSTAASAAAAAVASLGGASLGHAAPRPGGPSDRARA